MNPDMLEVLGYLVLGLTISAVLLLLGGAVLIYRTEVKGKDGL